ncbi:MAG: hypothetical protein JJT76_09345 [Clostridiaceae bacterium]|nr:hypothetical protein [Clostridiaceae bacterium]
MIASDSIAIDKIAHDSIPIKVEDKEFIGILIDEIQHNRFKEADEWLSESNTHILFLQGEQKEGKLTRDTPCLHI